MTEMREEGVVEEVGGMTGLHLEAILPLDVEVRRRDHVCSLQQGLLVLVVEEVDGGRGKGRKKNHGVQVAGMEIVPPGATHLQEGALLQEGVHPQGGAHLHGEAALLGGMKEEVMEEVGDVEVVEVDLLQGEVLHPGGDLLQDVDHLLGEARLRDGEEVLTMEVDLGGLDLAGVMTGVLQEGDRLQGEAPLLVGALHLAVGLHQGGYRLKGGDTRHAEDHPLAEMRAVAKEVLGGEEVVEEEDPPHDGDLHQGEGHLQGEDHPQGEAHLPGVMDLPVMMAHPTGGGTAPQATTELLQDPTKTAKDRQDPKTELLPSPLDSLMKAGPRWPSVRPTWLSRLGWCDFKAALAPPSWQSRWSWLLLGPAS